MRYIKTAVFCLAFTLVLSGCSSAFFPGAYKIDIRQGNMVSQDMIDQLELGMTKRQVRFVMGTPLLIDTFEGERWDYYFSDDTRDGNVDQEFATLTFENDLLATIETSLDL